MSTESAPQAGRLRAGTQRGTAAVRGDRRRAVVLFTPAGFESVFRKMPEVTLAGAAGTGTGLSIALRYPPRFGLDPPRRW
jgi:hypothetical protein